MDLLAPIQDIPELNRIGEILLQTPAITQAGTEDCTNSSQSSKIEPISTQDIVRLIAGSPHMEQESATDRLTEKFDRHCLDTDESKRSTSENLLMIISKDYLLRFFHHGDFKCCVGITAYDARDCAPENESEVILARRDEDFAAAEKIIPNIRRFIVLNKDIFGEAETEMALDEALAKGLLPDWLGLDLDMDSTAKFRSRTINPVKAQKRESTWGQHAGLYDGTGYGAGSSSRSSTATEDATDPICRCAENGKTEKEIDKMPA